MQLAQFLLLPSLARLQFRDATTLGLPLQLQAESAAANASAANASAANATGANATAANATESAQPPAGSYALDTLSSSIRLYHFTVEAAEAIRPAIVAVIADKLEVHSDEVDVTSVAVQPCARTDLCVTPIPANDTANGTANATASNGTANATASNATDANGTAAASTATAATALLVRKLTFGRSRAHVSVAPPAGTDVEVKYAVANLLPDAAQRAVEKLNEFEANPDTLLSLIKTEVDQQQLNGTNGTNLSAATAGATSDSQAFVALPIQGCADLDAQDTGRCTAGPGSAPASCLDLAHACSGGDNADVRDACPMACSLCQAADTPVQPPPNLAVPDQPAHAAAGSVGMHTGAANNQVVASDDPDLLAQANTTFVLQLVSNEDTPGSMVGMPGAVLDPKNDYCLTVGEADELGGYALRWTHCQHQDEGYDPASVPAEMQFYFLQDGRIAWAVNASASSANCVLQKSCDGAMVYDVGDCSSPEAAVLLVDASVAQSAERTKFVGTPLQGSVTGGGMFSDIHGPFQMYSHCDGVQTSAGCMHMVPRAGWTKLESQYLGRNSFTTEDEPAVKPLPIKDIAQEALHGDNRAAAEAIGFGLSESTKSLAGVQAGLASTGDRDRCGTWVTDGDRLFAWWYFVSTTKGGGNSTAGSSTAFVQLPFFGH